MVGYPGSGKTTMAKKIAEQFNCHHLSSDQFRKKISNQTRYDPVGDKKANKQSAKAYTLMYNQAAKLIKNNQKVVLDATHLIEEKRQRAIKKLLTSCDKQQLCYIKMDIPKKTINQRMAAFKDKANPSNKDQANESFYQAWKRVYGYFEDRKKRGLLSWPNQAEEGIEVINYDQIKTNLA